MQTPSQDVYKPRNRVRFVTATSLFDGHDASINIMRRMIQATGAEVIHLGHNRSVSEIVTAAIEEDVQGIAVTSYQGGHVEFFKYMIDLLRERGAAHIKVIGGGGGVIVPSEIRELEAYGVTRIYSPEDGQRMGLQGMINEVVRLSDFDLTSHTSFSPAGAVDALKSGERSALARIITVLESGPENSELKNAILDAARTVRTPVIGITGTGGAGKSSLTDELLLRFRNDSNDCPKIAVIAIDPTRQRTGGALLGDRIRFNSLGHPSLYLRSLATRQSESEISVHLKEVISACKLSGFDLVLVETSGTGQGDASIVPHVDLSIYVMTPEFGAASQLEKIEMLDLADFVVINKFERRGGEDALRDVRKQFQRNHNLFGQPPESMPVFGTMAAHFNDQGVTALYQAITTRLRAGGHRLGEGRLPKVSARESASHGSIIPPGRERYLADISDTVRHYHQRTEASAETARMLQAVRTTRRLAGEAGIPAASELDRLADSLDSALDSESRQLLAAWPETVRAYSGSEHVVKMRDREIRTSLVRTSLSGTKIPKVALPRFQDDGGLLRWLRRENLPGYFPFTAGVFPFKRENEDPTRMFAGEGDAFRTNQRFRKLSEGMPAKRLSTAFDSVTLYGSDPDLRPDIYGKVGNSGVSIATLDDMKVLYSGIDLSDPSTSVSMTINGPAPVILAMFFNTAIDQRLDRFRAENGRDPLPAEAAALRAETLSTVRGTVQADILKEDQGQNTCIFSTEFALRMMGDIQDYFVRHNVRNFYSVSISGYHIAEAGANPITQLAFTLANGFTYVESYLARGMKIDDFAPNLSFFFSNGMDPEYSVIGRVARRIWAVAMRDRYGANERSQKLKYHVQTSGRSLHAQEMAFNDIRTTLQALIAIYDNCNSLHTNAFDEAVTTPTEDSVRRALAIQLIINREWGLTMNENPSQGSFVIEQLTDLVEEAVLKEFEALSARGGVLGAMETGYQRGKIQDESMYYEHKKHDGSYPIIGVNVFRNPHGSLIPEKLELARSTDDEKRSQIRRLQEFQNRNRDAAHAMLNRLRQVIIAGENTFDHLMDAVRCCSLGQITSVLYEAGGQYRRNM